MSPNEPIQSVSPSPIRYAKPHGLWSQICGFPCSTMVSAAPLGRHPAGELMRHLGYTECICLLILLNRSVRPPVYSCQFSLSNIFFRYFFGCRCEWWNVWEQDMIGMICRGQRSYVHLCLQSLGTGRVGGLVLSTHAGRTQLQLERERGQMRTICTATDRTVLALYQL